MDEPTSSILFLENAFLVKYYCLDDYNIVSVCHSCDKPAAKQYILLYFPRTALL